MSQALVCVCVCVRLLQKEKSINKSNKSTEIKTISFFQSQKKVLSNLIFLRCLTVS